MQAYTYLLVDILTIIICFIFSFHKRIQFNKYFSAFIKASVLVAIPFIIWDVWFTKMGVWWFDSDYTVGLRIAGLPLEEWLFFICIPFACVFTYYCITKFFNLNWTNKFSGGIVLIITILCAIVAMSAHHKIYPLVTAIVATSTLLYLYFIAKVDWIGKATLVYLILMPGFFLVNGVLTGTGIASPIVNYNPEKILNIRMLTIPIEDAMYGFAQFLLNVYFFKVFSQKLTANSQQPNML